MNLMHLKYAAEVAKTKSINKAAENLYMGQPNLSRAIKELEESLGISIFKRTSRGIEITPQGEEFLTYANRILRQVEEVEELYRFPAAAKQRFSVSVPRASYISYAFSEFSKAISTDRAAELFYNETSAIQTINNVAGGDYKLGILRYQTGFEKYFTDIMEEKGLTGEIITEFSYKILTSKSSPLAALPEIHSTDLKDYIEIAHADPQVPSLPHVDVMKQELSEYVDKRIFVFERASQFELMEHNHRIFMWASPVQKDILDRFGLTQLDCKDNKRICKDILIRKQSYTLSELDKRFIEEIVKAKREIFG